MSWLMMTLRDAIRRHRGEDGQLETFVLALVIFLLILIISGRRVLVQ